MQHINVREVTVYSDCSESAPRYGTVDLVGTYWATAEVLHPNYDLTMNYPQVNFSGGVRSNDFGGAKRWYGSYVPPGHGSGGGSPKADLVVARPDNTWPAALSTGSSFSSVGLGLSQWSKGDFTALADVNGDGSDDLVTHNPGAMRFDVAIADGTGRFGGAIPGTGTWLSDWSTETWTGLGDINGDHKADLVVARPDYTWAVALSTGSSFNPIGIGLSQWGKGDFTALADVNGDGRDDLVTHNPGAMRFDVAIADGTGRFGGAIPGTGTWLSNWSTETWAGLGDVNGDHKADLVVARADNTWAVALSTGSSFNPIGIGLSQWGKGDFTALGDVNGDGRDDLVVHDPATMRFDVAMADGTGGFGGAVLGTGTWLFNWSTETWAGLGNINGA